MGTDNISKQQLSASFRGIPFSIRSEDSGPVGKRHISHEYPNSSRRHIEDLGSIPPIFTVAAFVHGVDYLKKAAELSEALHEDGPGVLSLPDFGTHSVFAMPFTKRASQRRVGEIEFSLTFYTGTDAVAPVQSTAGIEDVFDAGDSARESLKDNFEDIFQIPIERVSVETATADILGINDFTFDAIKDIATDLSDLTNIKERITAGIVNLIKDPIQLSNSLFSVDGLFQATSLAVSPGFPGIRAALTIASIGLNATLWPETTAIRIKRNENRKNSYNSCQIAGLVMAYEQAAGTDYSTQEEVVDTRALIESEYSRLIQGSTENFELVQSMVETRNALENVRKLSLEVMEQKQQQSFTLADIIQQTALSTNLLTYNYYAEGLLTSEALDEKSQVIRNLNPENKSTALFGNLKIIQDA